MVAVGGSIIAGGVVLVRSLVRRDQPRNSEDSALEALKLRYARGEIDKQEYEEKRKDLS
jgi:putative membrane protein